MWTPEPGRVTGEAQRGWQQLLKEILRRLVQFLLLKIPATYIRVMMRTLWHEVRTAENILMRLRILFYYAICLKILVFFSDGGVLSIYAMLM